jgi:hypothetical protein
MTNRIKRIPLVSVTAGCCFLRQCVPAQLDAHLLRCLVAQVVVSPHVYGEGVIPWDVPDKLMKGVGFWNRLDASYGHLSTKVDIDRLPDASYGHLSTKADRNRSPDALSAASWRS